MGLLGGVGGMVGGFIGNRAREKKMGYSRDELRNGIDYMKGTNVEADNAWGDYAEAPEGREAQLKALYGMQDVAGHRGNDAQSSALLQKNLHSAAGAQQQAVGAVTSNALQRGALGGGSALAGQLSAVQGGANGVYGAARDATADARGRALAALGASGQLGGDVRHGDLASESAKRNAGNAINTFNAGQRWSKAQGVNGGYTNLSRNWAGQATDDAAAYTGLGAAAGAGADELAHMGYAAFDPDGGGLSEYFKSLYGAKA